jgi:hypothetical protein
MDRYQFIDQFINNAGWGWTILRVVLVIGPLAVAVALGIMMLR